MFSSLGSDCLKTHKTYKFQFHSGLNGKYIKKMNIEYSNKISENTRMQILVDSHFIRGVAVGLVSLADFYSTKIQIDWSTNLRSKELRLLYNNIRFTR